MNLANYSPTMRVVVIASRSRQNLAERNSRIVSERPAANGMVPDAVPTSLIVAFMALSFVAAIYIDIFTN